MNVHIITIKHSEQRYDTVGDWQYLPNGDLVIKISNMGDWRYNALVALHELVETLLCKQRGISEEAVDRFDLAFKDEGEPGDDPNAPYYSEHQFATCIERLMCRELALDWNAYDKVVESLGGTEDGNENTADGV